MGNPFDQLPLQLQANYYYYQGRFYMFNDQYKEARISLKAAFALLNSLKDTAPEH